MAGDRDVGVVDGEGDGVVGGDGADDGDETDDADSGDGGDEATDGETETDGTNSAGDGSPGFGVLVALFAVLAGVGVARRR